MNTIEQKNAETVIAMQKRIDELEAQIKRVEKLRGYYENIGFNGTAKRIKQALKGK